ncbi:MAG: two-component sensor histidine kinase [Phycisphaeraceae bacterium]|nr:two-component sensor histidine kinase [Phycisphaeraceae bacterium]
MNDNTYETDNELTARHKALEAENAKLTESIRMLTKELEDFSYSVSHDLRAPLRAVDGFARLLQSEYGDKVDDEGRRLLGVVRDNASHMSTLMNGLLSYSRLGRQDMRLSKLDMTDLTQRVFAEQQAAVPDRQIEMAIEELAPAWTDRSLTQQILGNIIANAIKFTGPRDVAQIEISCQTDGAMNTYSVKDNGVGFDMTYVEKVFGMFQRLHTDDEFEGVGIGLALTQRLVRRHGGTIWAESSVGEGTTLSFTLPSEGQGSVNEPNHNRELAGSTSHES